MNIINNKYLNKNNLLIIKKKFLKEKSVKHIVLDEFLDENFYKVLIKEINNSNHNITGEKDGRQIIYIKGPASLKLRELYISDIFKNYIDFFYDDKCFLEFHKGGKNIFYKFFLLLFFCKKGFFYRLNKIDSFISWHTDGPESVVIGSFLLYLNDNWKNGDGGELELGILHNSGIKGIKKISPIGNRLVLLKYEGNKSWHRVLKCNKNRLFIHDQLLKQF